MLSPGDPAPAFTVSDHLGNTVSLGDFAGKHVVLWFYPKADTPGWTAEGCGFRDLAAEYAAKNAVVLGVSYDTVAENAAFAGKFSFAFPLLCDTDRSMGPAYGAGEGGHAARVGVIIGPDGTVVQWHASVDARAFPAEALAAIPG